MPPKGQRLQSHSHREQNSTMKLNLILRGSGVPENKAAWPAPSLTWRELSSEFHPAKLSTCKVTNAHHCKLRARLGATCYTAVDSRYTGNCPALLQLSPESLGHPVPVSVAHLCFPLSLSAGIFPLGTLWVILSSPALPDGPGYSESTHEVHRPNSWVLSRLPSAKAMAVPFSFYMLC